MKLISLNIELYMHTNTVLDFLKSENPDVICLQEFLEQDFELFKTELGLDGVFKPVSYLRDNKHMEAWGKRQGLAIFAKNIANASGDFYLGDADRWILF